MSLEIKNRRLRWLDYVQRIPSYRIPKLPREEPQLERGNEASQKKAWRRTVIKELQGLNRVEWRSLIAALCPSRDAEDE